MATSSLCQRLLTRLRAEDIELGPDEGWYIERTRAGHWQRSAGAWSWALSWQNERGYLDGCPARHYVGQIGSQWPLAQCLKEDFDFDGEVFIPKSS